MTLDSRRFGGGIVVALGMVVLASGLWLNPVVGHMVQGPRSIDHGDVLLDYFCWAMGVGAVLVSLGYRVRRGKSRADDLVLLAIMLSGVILADRFLLTRFGKTIWIHDTEIGYRHRPNVVRTLAGVGRPDDRVIINRWGFHDTDFAQRKSAGEFRALALGDSITMGYAIPYAETYSAQLEKLLRSRDHRFSSHQVINAGVHGYSTYQEKRVLERALVFSPDVIFVGFCMNDVTEPFVVDARYGGTGLDYHGVLQTVNPIGGWLANETGFGRLMQRVAWRGKSLETERRLEVYNVRSMSADSRTSARMQDAWRIVLEHLSELYGVAAQHRIPIVLVIFPYTFQLADQDLRAPQEILAQHAAKHGVHVIDTTDDFARAVFNDRELLEYMRRRGKSPDEILAYHHHRTRQFFFDDNHFTEAGHRLVAQRLLEYLVLKGLVGNAGG